MQRGGDLFEIVWADPPFEMWREGLDVVTLLCSNRAYRILQVELVRAGVAEPGPKARSLTQLDGPPLDWVTLARGFGVPASRVDSAEALLEALPRLLAAPGPHLVEVTIGGPGVP